AYRRQHPNFFINFVSPSTPDSLVPAGQFKWNPSYMSRAGLQALIAAQRPAQELFLIPNDLKPPKSNQWSIGARHDFGEFNVSATYNGTRSYNGFSFDFANLGLNPATNDCCISSNIPAYQTILLGNNTVHTWYNAGLFQLNRPYTKNAQNFGWGAGIAYTLSKAEAEGGDLFSFPSVTAGLNSRHFINDDRRHQFVLNGITDMPFAWGLQLSGLAQFSSGTPIQQVAFIKLPNPPGGNQRVLRGYSRSPWFQNVDLRLRKNFVNVGGNEVAVTGSVFNVLDKQNLGCYNTTIAQPGPTPGTTVPDAGFGLANCTIADPRRFQIGLTYDFHGLSR
ncbi:MAG: hypothetical protein ABJD07_16025, partial [Gemmatimonadaceae bacterium]